MVCNPAQLLLPLGGEEGVFNIPWDLCAPNSHMGRSCWVSTEEEAKAGGQSTSCNAAALRAWPSNSPVVSEWLGRQQPGMERPGRGLDGHSCRSGGHQPSHSVGPLCWQQFPWELAQSPSAGRAQPSSWGWTVCQVSPTVQGQVGTCQRGATAWKKGENSQSLEADGGLSPACLLGLLGALPGWLWVREQSSSCTLGMVVSGFAGGRRESWRPFLCLQLSWLLGQEIQGTLARLAPVALEKLCLTDLLPGGKHLLVEELCSRTALPCQSPVLLQPDCRVCDLVLPGFSSSKMLGWSWESRQRSGTGGLSPAQKSVPCFVLLSPSLWM